MTSSYANFELFRFSICIESKIALQTTSIVDVISASDYDCDCDYVFYAHERLQAVRNDIGVEKRSQATHKLFFD